MKTKARHHFLLPLAAALLAAPDLTAQPLLPTPASEPQRTQPFFDSAALLGLEPDQILSVPLPGDGARLDHNYGRQPLHFERNDGQTDAEVKFLARGSGHQLFFTGSEAVMTFMEPAPRSRTLQPAHSPRSRGLQPARTGADIQDRGTGTPATTDVDFRDVAAHTGAQAEACGYGSGFLPAHSPRSRGLQPARTGADVQDRETDIPATADADFRDVAAHTGAQAEACGYGGEGARRVLRMRAVGANPHASVSGEEMLRAKVNYFIGNDPSLWRTNIPTFGKVRLHEVYPGIDLIYYGNEGRLEYDFIVAPGAEPNWITLEFEGADDVRTDERGDLVLTVAGREIRWQKPVVYQEVNGVRREVAGSYAVKGEAERRFPNRRGAGGASDAETESSAPGRAGAVCRVAFEVAAYDPALPLVIDPALVYATYLGGSNSDFDWGKIAVDGDGSVYVAGTTASPNFPTKAALFPNYAGGGRDAFVSKFSASGELLFSTFLGGKGADGGGGVQEKTFVTLDAAGACYVAGATTSANFPMLNPVQPSLKGDADVFITSLKADGSSLLFSTYLGGKSLDEPGGLAVDHLGNVYAVGATKSPDFPTRNAIQPVINATIDGLQYKDGFITKLEAGGKSILYSTFYGRDTGNDYVDSVMIDSDENALVAMRLYDSQGSSSWLLSKFNADGSKLFYETPLGGNGFTIHLSGALGPNNRVILAGTTSSTDIPAINIPSEDTANYSTGLIAQFDARDGTFVSARYLGGSFNTAITSVSVDRSGDIIVVGTAFPSGFPLVNPLPFGGNLFLTKIHSTDLSIDFSTFLGGTHPAYVGSVECDAQGNILVAGTVNAGAKFPSLNAFQNQRGGSDDMYLLKLTLSEVLKVSRSGQSLVFSWSASASGYQLESGGAVGTGAAWQPVATAPVVIGDEQVVTVDIEGGTKFYRLKKP
jgi:hypothetical protein